MNDPTTPLTVGTPMQAQAELQQIRLPPVRLAVGLRDSVHDSQQTFRLALDALARPGRLTSLAAIAAPPVALAPAIALLLLTLTDETTAVHWQDGMPNGDALAKWLRFHNGASLAHDPADADFAVVHACGEALPLAAYKAGSAMAPAGSATVFIQVASLTRAELRTWQGPGVPAPMQVQVGPVPAGFWMQWQRNGQGFPEGVDVFWCCGDQLIGMPRTTRVAMEAPCMSR